MESHITFLNACKVIKQRKINEFPKARHITDIVLKVTF